MHKFYKENRTQGFQCKKESAPMTVKNKIEEAVEWYRQNRPLYEALAMSVQFIIQEVLKQKK
jgi:hypothetical protein